MFKLPNFVFRILARVGLVRVPVAGVDYPTPEQLAAEQMADEAALHSEQNQFPPECGCGCTPDQSSPQAEWPEEEEEEEEEEVCLRSSRCDCYDCQRALGHDLAVEKAARTGRWGDL